MNEFEPTHLRSSSIKMATPQVFTVRKAYSPALFTIRVDEKPAVVAFKNKKAAQAFVYSERRFTNVPAGKKTQPFVIDPSPLPSLQRRCSMNSLSLVVFDDDGEYTIVESTMPTMDDLQFHFENVIKYMS